MGIFDRFKTWLRPRRKGLYELHPELEYRIPILRAYSDEINTVGDDYGTMADYYAVNVWVNKAVSVLARNLGGLRLQVLDSPLVDAEPVEGHPVSLLLDNPNPAMSAADLWNEWLIMMMLGGDCGMEAVWNRGQNGILELWPRDPSIYTVRPGPGGARYRQAAGYTVDDGEGEPYALTPEQFIQFKFYNPANAWRGLAPISAVRMGVVIDQLAQAWTRLFFKNQARPDFAVIAPQGLTNSEREDMELKLAMKHGGDQAHRPIVLEQGVTDVKMFSWPPKDLEWLQQRQMSRDEIGAVFGVPDEIMGYGKDTYENFQTAERVLWTLSIVPLTRLRDDVLTRFFRKVGQIEPGERVSTVLSNVPQLQEDRTAKVNQFNILTSRGVPLNTAADWLGLNIPPVAGGDVGYLPAGMVPLELLAEGAGVPALGIEVNAGTGEGKAQAAIIEKAAKFSAPAYGSPEHEAIYKARQQWINQFVPGMMRTLKREIQRQQNEIGRKLRSSKRFGRGQYKEELGKAPELRTKERIPPVDELFDYEAEVDAFVEALRSDIDAAVKRSGQAGIAEVIAGALFDVAQPEVQQGIEHVLETVARKVNDTTYTELIDLFQEAEANGEGIPAIQERLAEYFGDRKSDWQTERIARTTMTGATNFGRREGWDQSEIAAGYIWISALLPDRTRDSHYIAHGQVIQPGEQYKVGDTYLAYPGDPSGPPREIINCLCVENVVVMD